MPPRRLMTMRNSDVNENLPERVENDLENTEQAAEVFADPVGYLANFGITAELVTVSDTGLALPVAA